MVASLFFGVLYGFPTRIFNALLPIAIEIHSDQIMLLNTVYVSSYIWVH